ncbi:MAG: hypothetical protein QXQ12_07630 [Zestosphaera sp.]
MVELLAGFDPRVSGSGLRLCVVMPHDLMTSCNITWFCDLV